MKRRRRNPLRRLALGVAVLAVCCAVAGCSGAGCSDSGGSDSGSEPQQHDSTAAESVASGTVEAVSSGSTVTVTDLFGRRIEFPRVPERIVSLSPSLTEIVFAIGAGERIVGATRYCDYPPAAEEIPRVGGGTLESLSQETIVALEPDLVLCKADTHEPLVRNLERMGIPALALGPETLSELEEHIRMLGELTGRSQQAEELVDSLERRTEAVLERIPQGERPTVFYEVWDEPLMTAGPDSYIGELLELAGARNLFEDSTIRYPKVSPEAVVAGNPDVILAPASHDTPVTIEAILARPGWSQVRAVREQRVYVIDRNHISRCGPRLIDALEEIVRVLYPDRFPPASRDRSAATAGAAQDRER